MPGFAPVNVAKNYLAGRQNAQDEQYGDIRNQLGQQSIQQNQQAMQQNQQAMQQNQAALSEDQQRKVATRLMQAAQYGIQSPSPKAFIEQNYPELAQAAGAQWQAADDNAVRAQLQDLVGKFGPQAGVGPAQPKERSLINTVGPDGKPVRGEDVPGASVYVAPEKVPPRFRAMNPQELKSYGLPDGTAAQINDTTGQIQVVNKPPDASGAGARGTFRNIQGLRKEFDGLPEVKNYKMVLPLFQRAATAPPTRAGDLSIIYALGKMFDPGSVVREGELILAQNTAPWLTNLVSKANSQLSGEGALSPETRAAIVESLKGQMESLRQPYDQERERFAGYADENGWEPAQVVGKATPGEAFGAGGPGGANAPAAPTAPVEQTATGPNGQKLALRNGKWVPL